MKSDKWAVGRWIVSSGDDWEGIFSGSYDTRQEAIEAGPAVMRAEGYANEEEFFVSKLIRVRPRTPRSLADQVHRILFEETFSGWEERPERKLAAPAEASLNIRLRPIIHRWAEDFDIFGGEVSHEVFEAVPMPVAA